MTTRKATRLSRRELFDLKPWIELNQPLPNKSRARRVIWSYLDAFESGGPMEPLAISYVMQAVMRALKSKTGDLAKELGLKRHKAGNPGTTSPKRPLTVDQRVEMDIEFRARLPSAPSPSRLKGDLSARNALVAQLAREYRVSRSTVEAVLSAADKSRAEEAAVSGTQLTNN